MTLSGVTTPGQNGAGSNFNEGVFHIPQSLTIRLFSVISRTFVGEVLLLCRDAVGVFCSPRRQDQKKKKSSECIYPEIYVFAASLGAIFQSNE